MAQGGLQMMTLVDKIRQLSRAVDHAATSWETGPVVEELSELLGAPVSLLDRSRQVLVAAGTAEGEAPFTDEEAASLSGRRSSRGSTRSRLQVVDRPVTRIPLHSQDRTLGTLVIAKAEDDLDDEQWVMIETAITAIGLILRQTELARREAAGRQESAVQAVLDALTYSELTAVQQLLNELGGTQGLVVTSNIADRVGITRSVIVNALRKLESAGVIETRSLGMKGTLIRILNDRLKPAVEALKV
jgi:GTP-sensing pleiotropic transcriptional regulator CodY